MTPALILCSRSHLVPSWNPACCSWPVGDLPASSSAHSYAVARRPTVKVGHGWVGGQASQGWVSGSASVLGYRGLVSGPRLTRCGAEGF